MSGLKPRGPGYWCGKECCGDPTPPRSRVRAQLRRELVEALSPTPVPPPPWLETEGYDDCTCYGDNFGPCDCGECEQ